MISNESSASQPAPASIADPADPTRKPIETGDQGGTTGTETGITDKKPPSASELELFLG